MAGVALASDLKFALDPVRWAKEICGVDLDDWQKDVVRCEDREVALLCYRQCGKSHVTAVKAAHHLVYHPGAFVVVVSLARRQSDELRDKIVMLLRNLPERVSGVRKQSDDKGTFFANGSRLLVVPDNPDATRGFSGVTMLIVEEAAFVSDELMTAAEPYLSSRLGQLVKLSTANGKRGHFYRTMQDPVVTRFLVKWTPGSRIVAGVVARFRSNNGDWKYRQEYECEFLDSEFSVVSRDVVSEAVDTRFKGLEV
mgnify:CR=1 FL=1